jgi:hypothetical protein
MARRPANPGDVGFFAIKRGEPRKSSVVVHLPTNISPD